MSSRSRRRGHDQGGRGDDRAFGMAGNDHIYGEAGADELSGDGGRDLIAGGAGADILTGGAGADRLAGGPGRDVIRARNHGRDRIDCGPGRDTAILDLHDGSAVRGRPPPAARRTGERRRAHAHAPSGRPAGRFCPPPAVEGSPPTPTRPRPIRPRRSARRTRRPPTTSRSCWRPETSPDCTPPAEQTAQLLDDLRGTVTPLGDTAYPSGSAEDFANCYDPTWGRHKHRTRPTVGSHEYDTPGAAAYWDYFGAAAGEAGKGGTATTSAPGTSWS